MNVTINGERHDLPDGATVLVVLDMLGLKPEVTVVERNADIVDRSRYDDTVLQEGDTLELVRIVGGG